MFQRFFEDGIESKFIKSLIYNTNLPSIDFIVDGDYVINGCTYIYETRIIECLKSGTFNRLHIDSTSPVESDAIVRYRADYIVGDIYDTFTRNRLSRDSYYDGETHRWLGDYLRYYRATKGIDLMPFYNCFNYTLFSNFILSRDSVSGIKLLRKKKDDTVKVFAIPIKLNKTYTLAADCMIGANVMPVYYNGYDFCKVILPDSNGETQHSHELTGIVRNLLKIKNTNIPSTFGIPLQFNIPLKFEIDTKRLYESESSYNGVSAGTIEKALKDYEKYLYFILQVPQDFNSSIAVIEGDKLDYRSTIVYNMDGFSNMSDEELDKIFSSRLSLLTINDRNIYAYNDRLVEYLLDNVISQNDVYKKDILTAQEMLGYEDSQLTGIWNNTMRKDIFDRYKKYNKNAVDFMGYLDKDAEKAAMNKRLMKGV